MKITQNIQESLNFLIKNEVLIAQTDTIIGFICLSSSFIAREKIFDLKQRKSTTPLAILVDGIEMVRDYACIDDFGQKLLEELGGEITIVSNIKTDKAILKITDNNTIGVRITECNVLQKLIKLANQALCATSVNLHGEPYIKNLEEAYLKFGTTVLETNCNGSNDPSTIINLTDPENIFISRPTESRLKSIKKLSSEYKKTIIIK